MGSSHGQGLVSGVCFGSMSSTSTPVKDKPEPDVCQLPLSKNGFEHNRVNATVSPDMWEYVSHYNWTLKRSKHNMYAQRQFNSKTMGLHRFIYERLVELGLKPALQDNQVVDHIDENGLNNTNDNLQPLTHGDNTRKGKIHIGLPVPSGPVRHGQFRAVDKCIYPAFGGSVYAVKVRGKFIGVLPTLNDARIYRNIAHEDGVDLAKEMVDFVYSWP